MYFILNAFYLGLRPTLKDIEQVSWNAFAQHTLNYFYLIGNQLKRDIETKVLYQYNLLLSIIGRYAVFINLKTST